MNFRSLAALGLACATLASGQACPNAHVHARQSRSQRNGGFELRLVAAELRGSLPVDQATLLRERAFLQRARKHSRQHQEGNACDDQDHGALPQRALPFLERVGASGQSGRIAVHGVVQEILGELVLLFEIGDGVRMLMGHRRPPSTVPVSARSG